MLGVLEFFTIIQSWQCWHYCQFCVPIYLQFFSLFVTNDVSKYEIRNQRLHGNYSSSLHALLHYLNYNGRAKTKLAMLAFLYWGEFVKNSADKLMLRVRSFARQKEVMHNLRNGCELVNCLLKMSLMQSNNSTFCFENCGRSSRTVIRAWLLSGLDVYFVVFSKPLPKIQDFSLQRTIRDPFI